MTRLEQRMREIKKRLEVAQKMWFEAKKNEEKMKRVLVEADEMWVKTLNEADEVFKEEEKNE